MPELFGIFNPSGLSQIHHKGLSRMRDTFTEINHVKVCEKEAQIVKLFTILNHKHDSKYLNVTDSNKFISGWLGQPIIFDDQFEQDTVCQKLDCSDFEILNSFHPPFCAVVFSKKNNCLSLISDPYGLYPLYYINYKNTIIFASKLSPLLRSGIFSWEINPSAVLEFFTYEHVLKNKTFAKNIELLPPGTILRFGKDKMVREAYTLDKFSVNEIPKTTSEVANTIYNRLQDSILRASKHSSHTAITLTGGMDSRAILGCAMESVSSLSAYTFGPENSKEVSYARALAMQADITHEVIPIDGTYLLNWLDHGIFITGGMVCCTNYQILSLADTLALQADLVLDGLGGDMLTGAHIKWPMLFAKSKLHSMEILHKQRATAWSNKTSLNNIFKPEFTEEIINQNNELIEYFDGIEKKYWQGCHNFDLRERQRRFIQYGPHQIRPFLPVHTPFYEPILMRSLLQVNIKHLIGQHSYRYMHRHHLKNLAIVPDTKRGVPITWPTSMRFGKRIIDAGRKRLLSAIKYQSDIREDSPTNYPYWFRNELRELIHDNILGNEHMNYIICKKTAETILQEHMRADKDHTTKLGVLLTFSSWLQAISK